RRHFFCLLFFRHARSRQFARAGLPDIIGIAVGRDQLVRAAVKKLQQIAQEPSRIRGTQEPVQRQIGDALAQEGPELKLIEKLKVLSRLTEEVIAITVEGRCLQCRRGSMRNRYGDALANLSGCFVSEGERTNLRG